MSLLTRHRQTEVPPPLPLPLSPPWARPKPLASSVATGFSIHILKEGAPLTPVPPSIDPSRSR